jgi:GT2 family glycosyltransferase
MGSNTYDRTAIVIVNYNGWVRTIKCLGSLQSLNNQNFDIFVVDNASEDDSVYIIQRFFPDITIIESKTNIGFAGGNNLALKEIMYGDYEYVWLLNNDTMVSQSALTELVCDIKEDEMVVITGSTLLDMDKPHNIQSAGGVLNKSFCTTRFIITENSKADYVSFASVLIRCSYIRNNSMFLNEKYFMYWEDVDYCVAARNKGYRISVSSESHVFHAESATSNMNKPYMDYNYTRSNLIFARKLGVAQLSAVVARSLIKSLVRVFCGKFTSAVSITSGMLSIFSKEVKPDRTRNGMGR